MAEIAHVLGSRVRRDRLDRAFQLFLLVAASIATSVLIMEYPPGWAALAAVCALALSMLVWKWPFAGFAVLFGLTLLFEQFDFGTVTPLTRRVPFFANLNTFTPLKVPLNPLEILLFMVAFAWFAKKAMAREMTWRENSLALPAVVFAASLGVAAVLGLLRGGDIKIIGWEIRAPLYLCAVVLLLPQLITRRSHVAALTWIATAAIGVKALQGIWRYAVVLRGDLGGERAITAHEDALFIASLLVLLAAMVFLKGSRAQRIALVLLTPAMLFTFVATNRRVAYVALAVGMSVLFVALSSDGRLRRGVVVSGLALSLALAGYVGLFSSAGGFVGRPARALTSIKRPTTTADQQSNLYRQIEEANLMNTIKRDPVIGIGFGRPYDMATPLSRIEFSLQDYIAHNQILWLWASLGTVGFVAFWMFAGAAIVKGLALFIGLESPYLRAIVLAAAVLMIMQLVISYADLQFTFYRNMIYLGTFLGMMASAERLDARNEDAGGRTRFQRRLAVRSVAP